MIRYNTIPLHEIVPSNEPSQEGEEECKKEAVHIHLEILIDNNKHVVVDVSIVKDQIDHLWGESGNVFAK